MLQEFDLEIKDKQGSKKFGPYHLSRLENNEPFSSQEIEINDSFLEEQLYHVHVVLEEEQPWFTNIANYLALSFLPKWFNYHQKKKFFSDIIYHIWKEHYVFRVWAD